MKRLLIAAASLLVSTATANAEGLSFASAGRVTSQLVERNTGVVITTTAVTGQVRAASGAPAALSGTCTARAVPGSRNSTSECRLGEAGGAFKVFVMCVAPDTTGRARQCSGSLQGETGAYAGRFGTMSWQNAVSADRKSEATSGSGNWVEG